MARNTEMAHKILQGAASDAQKAFMEAGSGGPDANMAAAVTKIAFGLQSIADAIGDLYDVLSRIEEHLHDKPARGPLGL